MTEEKEGISKTEAFWSDNLAHLSLHELPHVHCQILKTFKNKEGANNSPVSVGIIQSTLDLLSEHKKLLAPTTLQQAIDRLADAVLEYSKTPATSQDESFRKVTKKDITDIVEKLELILTFAHKANLAPQETNTKDGPAVTVPGDVYRVPELVHLNFALRCLQLPVLEKKLIGGTLLIMKVLQVKRTMEQTAGTNANVNKWLDKDKLVDWIESNNIFNIFFGGSLHPEVIKKSFYLLNFLYTSGRIEEAQLAQMWNVATKKHEAFKAVILKALAFLATVLKPKELRYLFEKLRAMTLKDHDAASLALLKAIAKAIAQKKSVLLPTSSAQQKGFVQGKAGLIEAKQKRRSSFDEGVKKSLLGNTKQTLDLASPKQARKKGEPNQVFDLLVSKQASDQPKKQRKQRSLSPGPKTNKEVKFNEDIFTPWGNDQEDIELQRTLALSLQEANAPAPKEKINNEPVARRRMNGDTLITNENLFDVPPEKEDKRTADDEMSPKPHTTETPEQLNLPIDASRQLQTPHEEVKQQQFPVSQFQQNDWQPKELPHKPSITDYFFFDQSLGLPCATEQDIERKELAAEVLQYMWSLCLDEAVFGVLENQQQNVVQLIQLNNAQPANLQRIGKGLSVQNHQLCIEQMTEVLNYNYPHGWFKYVHEAARRLKSNLQPITMQVILKKLILGVAFPMLDKPPKPIHPEPLPEQSTTEEQQHFKELMDKFEQDQSAYEDQLSHVANLPKNRLELFQTLEDELNLTTSCLSAYIHFKRTSLQLINANFNQGEQDDNLETQSSLDGDDDKSSALLNPSMASASGTETQHSHFLTTSSFDKEEKKKGKAKRADNDQARSRTPQARDTRVIYDSGEENGIEEVKEELKTQNVRRPTRQAANNESRSFLDTMVTNQIYKFTFEREMLERLDFLRFIVTQNPQTLLKAKQIQVLWESLVTNAFYEKERDQFFIWCTDVLKAATKKQTLHFQSGKYDKAGEEGIADLEEVFSEDCLDQIYFDTLLKLDFRHFTMAIYNCFEAFFIHANEQYGQIVTGVYESQMEVFEYRLIGMEALWEIVLQARDVAVHQKAMEFIQRIYKRMNQAYFQEKLFTIKMNLLDICNQHIRQGQTELALSDSQHEPQRGFEVTPEDSTNRVSRSIKMLSKFIEDFEGFRNKATQQEKKPKQETMAQLKINNMVAQTMGPKHFDMTLNIDTTTIENIMNQVAQTIFPKRPVRELQLLYKGRELKEMLKTLRQVMGSAFNPGQPAVMILTSKSELELEYEGYGQKAEATEFDPDIVNALVLQMRDFLEGSEVTDDVIALALKKNNLNLEEAIVMIVDEATVLELQQEIEREQEAKLAQERQNMMIITTEKQEDDQEMQQEDRLNVIVSNNAEYFDMLFDLLNLGNCDITSSVWNLLMQVPVNQSLLQKIKTLQDVKQIAEKEIQGWSEIVDPASTYKMLYSLQILNTLISVNNERLSEGEVQERFEWRQRFLELGGFNHLYTILITSDVQDMLQVAPKVLASTKPKRKLNKEQSKALLINNFASQRNDQARCLAYLLSIIKIFLQAALLTFDQENLLSLIVQSSTSPFVKVKGKQVGDGPKTNMDQLIYGLAASGSKPISDSNSNSGTHTPTFGAASSGNTTPSKNLEKAANEKLNQLGQEKVQQTTFTQVDDFPRLVEQMKNANIATHLIDKVVDFQELIRKLMQIVHSAVVHWPDAQEGKTESEDQHEQLAQLVQHAVDLLLPCVMWQPDQLLRQIEEYPGLETLLVHSLLHNPHEGTRKSIERTFRIICTSKPDQRRAVRTLVLRLLLKNMPKANQENEGPLMHRCEEYFSLLSTLVRSCSTCFVSAAPIKVTETKNKLFASNEAVIDFSKLLDEGESYNTEYLLQVLVNQISLRPVLENKNGQVCDKVLAGYLQTIQALLEVVPDKLRLKAGRQPTKDQEGYNLVNRIFDYLCNLPQKRKLSNSFAKLPEDVPKFKSRLTRKRAFKLLLTLASSIENYTLLLERLYYFYDQIQQASSTITQDQLQEFFTLTQTQASASTAARSSVGYVGLRNFGCTCYMNSLMQQLYMIPEFRAGILKVPEKQLRELNTVNGLVVLELQKIFANLQESEKQAYKPQGFVDVFQWYGEAVNVRQQQDTNEFFNILCEYIDNCCPETAQVLKSALGGVIVNETKSLEAEYPYIGLKEEPFFALALDIKDKKSLQEALDLYVKPDILEGDNKYQCEKYDNRLIDVQRRTYLKSLPPTVVFNLKRFDFNYQTLERIKINDYCEFPEVIDLRPWTKQGIYDKERRRGQGDSKQTTEEIGAAFAPSDQEMEDLAADVQNELDDDSLSAEELDEDEVDPCSNFSENEAIESDEEFEMAIQPEQEKRAGFEELIGYTQEDDLLIVKNKDQLSPQTVQVPKKRKIKEASKREKKEHKSKAGSDEAGQDTIMYESSEQTKKMPKKKQAKTQAQSMYQLVGVLVHSGSANSGHYYSYIKERKEFVQSERWLEFNDTNVTEFDKTRMAQECFGTQKRQQPSQEIMWERCCNAYLLFYQRIQSETAAIKDKEKEKPLPLVDNQEILPNDSSDNEDSSKSINNIQLPLYKAIWDENQAFIKLKLFFDPEYLQFARDYLTLFKTSGFANSPSAEQQIDTSSLYFPKHLSLSDQVSKMVEFTARHQGEQLHTALVKECQQICESVVKLGDILPRAGRLPELLRADLSLHTIKFAIAMSYDIAFKFRDVNSYVQWAQLLDSLFERNALACVWLVKSLSDNKEVLSQLLLEHNNFEVREAFSKLLKTVINVTAKNEEAYFHEKISFTKVIEDGHSVQTIETQVATASVIRFMEYFFGQLFDGKVRENWRRYEEYFSVLKDFSQQSFFATKFMLEQKGIVRLLEFLMNCKTPFADDKKPKMGEGNLVEPALTQPLDLVSFLTRSTFTNGIAAENVFSPTSVYQDEDRKLMIPVNEIGYFLRDETMNELLRRCSDSHSEDAINALANIVSHLSWGDRNVSQFFVRQLLNFLDKQSNDMNAANAVVQYDATLRVLCKLLCLQDGDRQFDRFGFVFDLSYEYIDSKPLLRLALSKALSNPVFTVYILKFVVETAATVTKLRNYLRLYGSVFKDSVIDFLRYHREAAPDKTVLKPLHGHMLGQVSQKYIEFFGLEFDFAFDYENNQATARGQTSAQGAQGEQPMADAGGAFAGMNANGYDDFQMIQADLELDADAKMFFNADNLAFQDDHFGGNSMDVEMGEYEGDKIFDDDF